MSTPRLSYDELAVAEQWLSHPDQASPEAIDIIARALIHLRYLLKQDLSKKDLTTYLRMQMGVDPKSEKLENQAPANQSPGSAIFRR